MKDNILGAVEDLVSNFLYYDRKEDENLPLDAIDDAIKNGDITIDEIVNKFTEALRAGLQC